MSTNPTYNRRDTATAKLRKLGVTKEDYPRYLKVKKDGVEVLLDLIEKDRTSKKPRGNSISSVARQLITEGKTNVEVWRELCKRYPTLTEKQKHYPAWYRAEMKRNGTLPKEAVDGR